MSNENIIERVRAFKELQIFIKQLEDEAEAHKQAIINEIANRQMDSLITRIKGKKNKKTIQTAKYMIIWDHVKRNPINRNILRRLLPLR